MFFHFIGMPTVSWCQNSSIAGMQDCIVSKATNRLFQTLASLCECSKCAGLSSAAARVSKAFVGAALPHRHFS